MAADFEVIVLGLGAMGSASVYQLAKRGKRVLGIDRFAPPHAFGSSHGETRITRQAIGEGEHYTPLSLRSYEIFRELEGLTGKSLLQVTGGLIISSPTKTGLIHVPDLYEETVRAANKHSIRHELLDAAQLRRRFPQFKISDNEYAYYEYEAGFLRPEQCVGANLEVARGLGATIHANEIVKSFREDGSRVRVTTDGGTEYTADRLVVSAGAWLPELLGEAEYGRLFQIHRQVLYWFDIEQAYEEFRLGNFPIYIWEIQDPRANGMYGFPAIDGPQGGMKIATADYGENTTADTVNRTVSMEEITGMFEKQVAPYFPTAGSRCVRTAVCLYTVSPDSGFVIDHAPGSKSVIICSPCSGHGFKHSAAIGETIAQLAGGENPTIDLGHFKLSRFAKQLSSAAQADFLR